ncbi:MAG: hypothetical protein ACTSRE_01130 [Promethearchaeota archaeon]
MKRIQSLDVLRGICMLFLVVMHTFMKVGWHNIGNVLENMSDYPWYVLAPLGIFSFIATWRGLFMLISGVGSIYGFQKAIQQGKSPHIILLKQLLWAFVLFIQGMAIQVFWNPYTGLYRMLLGIVDPNEFFGHLRWSDAVETIAISIAISSIIQYFLCLGKKRDKYWISITVYLALTIAILVSYTFVVNSILNATEFTEVSQIKYGTINNFRDRIRLLGLALLIGEQQPLFPHIAAFFLGNAFGIALTRPELNKKWFLRIGILVGLIIVIAAFFVGFYVEHFEIVTTVVPNQWYFLACLGIQTWFFVLFMHLFDFSKKAQKRVKNTKIIRKAGILSLTIFSLQSIDFIPRFILTGLSSAFSSVYETGTAVDFLSNSGSFGIGASLLASFVVLFFWIGIITLWEKINFALSFDWIFTVFRNLLSGRKINWKDPMHSQDIIYNPESIFHEINPSKLSVETR